MEIILLEKIQNLGELGEVVTVKNGYARNFLIPQKKAVRASKDAKALVEERRRQLAAEESKRIEVAKARQEILAKAVELTRLSNAETGHLYGSVAPIDIAEALSTDDITVEKSEVFLPDGPIKEVGEYTADIILHPEVRFSVSVKVAGEAGEDPLADQDANESEQDSEEEA